MSFQNSVSITPNGMPEYLAGDKIGNLNYFNPELPAIVNINSSIMQSIGSFTWLVNGQTATPLKADSPSGILLGFVSREQNTPWPDALVLQGYSMAIKQGYQFGYYPTGSFAAICPTLNGGGAILIGDIVLINNTTGALASQTSTTIPTGYTQCITSGKIWYVIDNRSVSDAQGSLINNLVGISNVQFSIGY